MSHSPDRSQDTARLRARLAALEPEAARLDWAAQRPWTAATHVWGEGELPTVDLHDLNARLAREAVRALAEVELSTGAVRLVTGAGRHSHGAPVLQRVVLGELRALGPERGWRWRPAGSGRLVLITDGERAPREATGALGPWFWLGVLAFLGALAWLLPPVGIPLLVAALALLLLGRRR